MLIFANVTVKIYKGMTERSIREIEEMGEGKYINPYTDFGFKKLFGTPLNKDLLISFLNSLFEGKEVVSDLTYLNGENLGNGYAAVLQRQECILRYFPYTKSREERHLGFQTKRSVYGWNLRFRLPG